jgi:hypothetical protein
MQSLQRALLLACPLFVVACRGGTEKNDIPDNATTGSMVVDVGGDATRTGGNDSAVPDTVDEVWLRIDQVSVYHETEGWIFIDDGRKDVNLMDERDGSTEAIGTGDVYAGMYDTLRISLVDSWIVVEGVEYDLTISNGIDLDNNLDLTLDMRVDQDESTSVWVGWDLDNQLSGADDTWTLGTNVNLTSDVSSN